MLVEGQNTPCAAGRSERKVLDGNAPHTAGCFKASLYSRLSLSALSARLLIYKGKREGGGWCSMIIGGLTWVVPARDAN